MVVGRCGILCTRANIQVSVNEAAAQICHLRPALLTRRDELFPLARRVVKDAGYHYIKGSSKSVRAATLLGSSEC